MLVQSPHLGRRRCYKVKRIGLVRDQDLVVKSASKQPYLSYNLLVGACANSGRFTTERINIIILYAGRGSDGPVYAWTRAGPIGNLVKIPDEGGRGQEFVTPGLPSHDCILLVKPRNRRYRLRIKWLQEFTRSNLAHREP